MTRHEPCHGFNSYGSSGNADEALADRTCHRVVETGTAREEAEKLAEQIGSSHRNACEMIGSPFMKDSI